MQKPQPITDSTELLHRISRLSSEAAWTTEEVQEALRAGGVDPDQLVCRILTQVKRLLQESPAPSSEDPADAPEAEERHGQRGETVAAQPQSLLECFRARTGWKPSVIASTLEVTPIFLSDLSRYRHVVPWQAQEALADRAAQRLPNVQRTDVLQIFAHASPARVAAFRQAPYPETEPMTYAEMINHSGMPAEAQHFWRSFAEKRAE